MQLIRLGLLITVVFTLLIQAVATASDKNDIPLHINGFLNQQTSKCNAGDVIPVVIIKRNDPTRMYTTMEQTIDHLDIAASASDGKFTGTFFFCLISICFFVVSLFIVLLYVHICICFFVSTDNCFFDFFQSCLFQIRHVPFKTHNSLLLPQHF